MWRRDNEKYSSATITIHSSGPVCAIAIFSGLALIFLGDDITDARSRSRCVDRRQRIGNVTIERGLAVYVYALGHVRRIDAGKRPWQRICFF
jgi:hypothetical protein